jgi:hypothetical protein
MKWICEKLLGQGVGDGEGEAKADEGDEDEESDEEQQVDGGVDLVSQEWPIFTVSSQKQRDFVEMKLQLLAAGNMNSI